MCIVVLIICFRLVADRLGFVLFVCWMCLGFCCLYCYLAVCDCGSTCFVVWLDGYCVLLDYGFIVRCWYLGLYLGSLICFRLVL